MLNKGSLFSPKREEPAAAPAGPVGPRPSPVPPLLSGREAVAASAGSVITRPAPGGEAAPAGATLVVGPGVKLKGAEIQNCDTLVVEGRVEATMDSRFIQIADAGSFDGKVNIDVAEIRGRFAGEMTAREQIVIYASGQVSGKIRYGRIVVHEGGELSGDVRSLTSESAARPPAADRDAGAPEALGAVRIA